MRQDDTLHYLFTDHLGSTSVTYNTANGQTQTLRYYPWGSVRSGDVPTDRRFTGQRWDATIGLYDYQARFYDPGLGRFVQPDTIVPDPGTPQDLNRYAYARNNPQMYMDPQGHNPVPYWIRRAYRTLAWITEHVEFSPTPKQPATLTGRQQKQVAALSGVATAADVVALSLSGSGALGEIVMTLVDGPAPVGDVGAVGVYYAVINPVENTASGIALLATTGSDVIRGNTFIQLDPVQIGVGQDTLVSTVGVVLGNLLPLEGVLDTAVNIPIVMYDVNSAAGNIPTYAELRWEPEKGFYLLIYPPPEEKSIELEVDNEQ